MLCTYYSVTFLLLSFPTSFHTLSPLAHAHTNIRLLQLILSLQIDSSDVAGVESKVRKGSGEYRFFLDRPREGKYLFKVMQEVVRDEWIETLQRVINVSLETEYKAAVVFPS